MNKYTEQFYEKLKNNGFTLAYSPLYERYVTIDDVYSVDGEHIVNGILDGEVIVFRPNELEDYHRPGFPPLDSGGVLL
jgi:hypothetical protein